MVATFVIHGITWIITHLPIPEGCKAELALYHWIRPIKDETDRRAAADDETGCQLLIFLKYRRCNSVFVARYFWRRVINVWNSLFIYIFYMQIVHKVRAENL